MTKPKPTFERQLALTLSAKRKNKRPQRKRAQKPQPAPQNQPIRLSPTGGLSLFRECPRCFWLHFNMGVHRPRGIFPSLPGGMDLVIKDYFDHYRGGLPPELDGKVTGVLLNNPRLLSAWRNWRTGLEYVDAGLNASLFGALDDCLTDGKLHIPLDYKTKGSAPRAGDSERYYQTQLDSYALMLQENGYPASDVGYLVYYYPKTVGEQGAVRFAVEPVKIGVSAERARVIFTAAVECLRGPLPHKHSLCEYCSWNEDRNEFE